MRRWLVVLVITVLALAGCSPNPGTHPRSSVANGVAQSDDLFTRLLAKDRPGCSAAIGIKGEAVWTGARGIADLDTKRPLTVDSVFDIASVSKQFTATAILLLAAEGKLSLGDSLSGWVGGMPAWALKITVADLVHHTSGIPDYTEILATKLTEATTQQDALDAIASVDRPASPGVFRYSNSNYVLLAEVVQAASGTALPDFLDQRVFGPLGLKMRLAPQYESALTAPSYQGGQPAASRWKQIGDGSIYTSPSELVRWADNYRTGAVGGQSLLDAIVANAVDTGGGGGYGAGIEVAADGALSHLGGWAGYVTAFGISPDRSTAIALSCNTTDIDIATLAEGLRVIWAG